MKPSYRLFGVFGNRRLLAVLLLFFVFLRQSDAFSELETYGDRVTFPLHPVEVCAMENLLNKAKAYDGASLSIDGRLVLMARHLARSIAADLSRSPDVLSSELPPKLRVKYGIYENNSKVRAFLYSSKGDLKSQILLRYGDRKLEGTHVGAGVVLPTTSRPGIAVVVYTEKRVELDSFPREVRAYSSRTLSGKLVNSTQGLEPKIVISYPDGVTASLDGVRVKGNEFAGEVAFKEGPGIYWIEVVAGDRNDSIVCALLKVKARPEKKRPADAVTAGTIPETYEVEGFSGHYASELVAEEAMIEMINQVRKKAGLAPVKSHHLLALMARRHSRDMRDNDYTGHYSRLYGPVDARSRAAGLGGHSVKENVALANNLVAAMNNLLQSPAHRSAIMDPRVNRVGVGIVFDNSSNTRHYYITQEFAAM